jgi:hypothetical protein
VLAPGDGEAEPGVTATNFREPAKLATDGGLKSAKNQSPSCFLVHVTSVAHFVSWDVLGSVPPGSAAFAWG